MTITITVPDKIFALDAENRFQDFFARVICDIADSINNNNLKLCGRYELETASFLRWAFKNGQYLEDGTEKIKEENDNVNNIMDKSVEDEIDPIGHKDSFITKRFNEVK